jgi:septal ring factor EnvC (AmiA/AmiB activator)
MSDKKTVVEEGIYDSGIFSVSTDNDPFERLENTINKRLNNIEKELNQRNGENAIIRQEMKEIDRTMRKCLAEIPAPSSHSRVRNFLTNLKETIEEQNQVIDQMKREMKKSKEEERKKET